MLYKQLPDELDPAALDIVLSAFKGQIPDKSAAFLCALNVAGFAGQKTLGQPAVMQAGPESQDVDAAFAAAKACCASPTMMASGPVGLAIPWFLILGVAIKVLEMLAGHKTPAA